MILNTSKPFSQSFCLEPKDNSRLVVLCGPLNDNLRQVEDCTGVVVSNNNFDFVVKGAKSHVNKVVILLKSLYEQSKGIKHLNPRMVHLALCSAGFKDVVQVEKRVVVEHDRLKTKHSVVKPLGDNQRRYVNDILEYDVTFGVGPAGTGKTFLAVACAVLALEQQRVSRVVLVRPAVEAGEHLGFLPGDFAQKVDPYLRPLYDALYEIMGVDRVNKFIEDKVIEIVPVAFMRGRTLNNSFVILDEGQNTTVEQMKMFLTRLGFGSKAVITGDITQIDLPDHRKSGLCHVIDLLKDVEGISFDFFDSKDVIRHPLVQKIIDAYDVESAAFRSERHGKR